MVVEILKNNPDWELKCPPRFRSWKRKGLRCSGLLQSQADCLIRCHPEDGMNGFFVALFVRKSSQPTAKYKRSIPQVCRQGKRRRVVTVKWKPIHKLI